MTILLLSADELNVVCSFLFFHDTLAFSSTNKTVQKLLQQYGLGSFSPTSFQQIQIAQKRIGIQNLESLCLSSFSNINDTEFQALIQSVTACNSLKIINLSSCSQLQELDTLKSLLLNHSKSLTKLLLKRAYGGATEEQWQDLLLTCMPELQSLKYLSLRETSISARVFEALVQVIPSNLTSLDISGTTTAPLNDELVKRLNNIKKFTRLHTITRDKEFEAISKMKQLEELAITCMILNYNAASYAEQSPPFVSMTHLTSLHMTGNYPSSWLSLLPASLRKLSLNYDGNETNSKALSGLADLTKLTKLCLMSTDLLKSFSKNNELKKLSLYRGAVNAEVLQLVSNLFPNLVKLKVVGITYTTRDSNGMNLAPLKTLVKLKEIYLDACYDVDISTIPASVEKLILRNTNLVKKEEMLKRKSKLHIVQRKGFLLIVPLYADIFHIPMSESGMSIEEMKKQLGMRVGLPASDTRLICAGKGLSDQMYTNDYRITDQSKIHMVLRLKPLQL